MSTLFVLLPLIPMALIIIGLIKPKLVIYWGKNRTRKQVLIYYGVLFFAFFILYAMIVPPDPNVNHKITQEEQAQLDKQKTPEGEKAKTETNTNALANIDPNEQRLLSAKENKAIRIGYARSGYFSDIYYNSIPAEDIVKSTLQKMEMPEGTKLEVLEDEGQTGFSIVRFLDENGNTKIVWVKSDVIVNKELYDYCKEEIFTNSDCERVKKGEIWIGMSLAMLNKQRGVFDTKNVTNVGLGNSWQFCWWNHTPSCFYDSDDDGKMDSYN